MDDTKKKKIAASAVATVTAAGVLVGGVFTSPADIMDDGADALVMSVDMNMDGQLDAGDGGADEGEEDEGRKGMNAALRRLVRQAPAPLRACVAVPLWLLGALLINLGSALWGAVLSPVFSAVIDWAAIALMVLIVFALAAKTIAPELPLKKILNKRAVFSILALCLAFGLLDNILPLFVEGYDSFRQMVKALGSCICAAVPIGFFLRFNKRRLRARAEKEAELSYEQREQAARRLIEELADSVCQPR